MRSWLWHRNGIAKLEADKAALEDKGGDNRDKLTTMNNNLTREQGKLKLFVRNLKVNHPYIAARWGKSPAELIELQAKLGPNTGIVQYLLLPKRSYAFVILKEQQYVVPLEDMDGSRFCPEMKEDERPHCVTYKLDEFVAALGAGKKMAERAEELGELFSRALLWPVEDHIAPVRHVILVPNGPLHRLPWAALKFEKNDNTRDRQEVSKKPYLVQEKVLTILPTSSLVGALLAKREKALGMLALGAPFGNLIGTVDEVEVLKELSSDFLPEIEKRKILPGEDVSMDAVIDQDLRRHVLHFATHGEATSVENTHLLLGDDSEERLTYDQIIQLNIEGSPLVVLSACETGDGKILSGDEVHSLADAFLHAHARSVVYTIWLVEDGSTKDLMVEFYGRLSRNRSVSKALALAQRQMIAEDMPPAAWAGFQVSEWTGGYDSEMDH